jgi:hypothetical protein
VSRLAALALLACCACTSAGLAPDRIRTRFGPAKQHEVRRVVALPSSCGSLTGIGETSPETGCPSLEGLDAAIRTILDFYGHAVIDSETLNVTTMARTEVEERVRSGSFDRTERRVERSGVGFADATPAMQDAVLRELGADGVLTSRVWIGAGVGASARRDVQVVISLIHVGSGELVWASRCTIEAGLELNEGVVMEAARCAAGAATGL